MQYHKKHVPKRDSVINAGESTTFGTIVVDLCKQIPVSRVSMAIFLRSQNVNLR